MILTLLKRAVKRVLHDAADEWLVKIGVPSDAVEELRREHLAKAATAKAMADAEAAAGLGVADDAAVSPAALLMPPAARTTTDDASPAPQEDSASRRRSRRGRSE
jgi:hypothetical protein